jgi:hypothetical protein
LGEELDGMLEDFCTAHHGASPLEVTKRALRDFIERDIAGNGGVRKEYERLQQQRRQGVRPKIVPIERS